MNDAAKNRLMFLDNLRGFAALYVLVYHVYRSPEPDLAIPGYLDRVLNYGATGVWLFFVISAFSLSLTMKRHIETGSPFISFAISRFFRIAPLFYVIILFQVARDSIRGYPYDLDQVAMSFSLLFNLSPQYAGSIAWGGWAIGPEILFYIAFPFLYFYARPLIMKIAILTAFVVLFAAVRGYLDQTYEYRSLLRHAPNFMMGLVVYDLYVKYKNANHSHRLGKGLLAVGLLAFAYCSVYRPPHIALIDVSHFESMTYALIVLGAGLSQPKWLATKIMSFYGRISFSVYLWHLQLIFWLTPWLRMLYSPEIPIPISFLAATSIILAVTTVVATASYQFIERPAEKFGKRLISRVTGFSPLRLPSHSQMPQQ